jgi:hypothetical protein
MQEILAELSSFIEVPAAHATKESVFPMLADERTIDGPKPVLRVRSGADQRTSPLSPCAIATTGSGSMKGTCLPNGPFRFS